MFLFLILVINLYYTKKQIERWAPKKYDRQKRIDRLNDKNPFVALVNGKIVGFAELEKDGHIDYFYCHHKFQGQGIGSALLAKVENEAKKNNIKYVYGECSKTAITFFKAKGFKIIKETNKIRAGSPAKRYHIRKDIV